MPTFAGVTFETDAEQFNESREARVAVQEIPGGDTFYVDRAGRSPLKWTVGMLLPNGASYGSLNAVLGTQGELSISGLDIHQAVLMRVSRPAPEIDGQTRATAEFLIVDA